MEPDSLAEAWLDEIRWNLVAGDNRRDAVTEWRDELGYDPITGAAL
jgi:hypothetical protein